MSYTVVPTITSRPRGRVSNAEHGHSLLYFKASHVQAPCAACGSKPALLAVPQRAVESERMPFAVQQHPNAPAFAAVRASDESKLPAPPIYVRQPELYHPRPAGQMGHTELSFTIKRFEAELLAREERKSVLAQPLRRPQEHKVVAAQNNQYTRPTPPSIAPKAYWPEGLPPLPVPPKMLFPASQQNHGAVPPPLLRTQSDPGSVVETAVRAKELHASPGLHRAASTASRPQVRPVGPRCNPASRDAAAYLSHPSSNGAHPRLGARMQASFRI
ncbi:hypothetical protein EXIGLDRAFT_829424 [Exidia glandulosa HHB12029]|uniref:Uncharacterized protein n=1 Tax=Exidia glandulosa HHB12029 TaxID=1314781 RepID=A0A165PI64_EXIGL|nr:hypothetical protein EXIGLDRAFT_829424 [Exidia glandulosa HHB12029]